MLTLTPAAFIALISLCSFLALNFISGISCTGETLYLKAFVLGKLTYVSVAFFPDLGRMRFWI